VDRVSEAQVQHELVATPEGQSLLRGLAVRRAAISLGLVAALTIFLWWLPASSRQSLVGSLFANRLLIGLLSVFGLIAISLLWSLGQRLDVWLFRALNLNGYHAAWWDRVMWLGTQAGNAGLGAAIVVVAYLLGYHGFAIALTLGSLTLWLLVTIIKALTDRARPFNLLRDTRVIGWRAHGLSFPSGHTAQTFFTVTLAISQFKIHVVVAVVLYGLAIGVGITRVYLGMHYPRDVIAGAILAIIWGILGVLVAPYL